MSIGALSATCFSSSNIFAFLAINDELFKISKISTYGSFGSKSISLDTRFDITELLNIGYFDLLPTFAIIVLLFKIFLILTVVPFFKFF